MITVYVLVTFYDDAGIHYAGTICKVKAENFDPRFMKKVKSPSEYVYSKTEVDEMMLKKQDDLTAGTNIQISDEDVISATDTGDIVSVTQIQTTGTKIATVTVNSVDTDLYAPNGGGGGGSTDIIADEFDTTGTVTPPAGTLYMAGDVVKRSSNFYSCKNDSTQSGTWTASKWTQLTVATVSAPGVSIDAGGYALDSDKLYRNDNQWGSAWFTPGNPPSGFTEIPYTTYDTTPYSPGGTVYASYNVGDYVIYEDELYRCVSSTTGGTWVAAKWSKTQVMDEMPAPGSTVSVTQVQSTGTKIATITVDSTDTDIYAPSSGGGGGGSTTILGLYDENLGTFVKLTNVSQNQTFDLQDITDIDNPVSLNETDFLAKIQAGPCFFKDSRSNTYSVVYDATATKIGVIYNAADQPYYMSLNLSHGTYWTVASNRPISLQ